MTRDSHATCQKLGSSDVSLGARNGDMLSTCDPEQFVLTCWLDSSTPLNATCAGSSLTHICFLRP